MEHEKQMYQKSTNTYCKINRSQQYMRIKWNVMYALYKRASRTV